ncbi:MAG TPA: prolyl oligopeptidase family serine peptidase [Kofleriaceae bacterium]|nr:prolyl oligopeptidase family serine peptidase [Kofleriaceae bacterium]
MRCAGVTVTLALATSCKAHQAAWPNATQARCDATAEQVACLYQSNTIVAAWFSRDVHWQVPAGQPPRQGWPAVILFQGSLFSAERAWAAQRTDAFGAYYQTETVRTLLEHGFAVLTPETKFGGHSFWDTNVLPFVWAWRSSPDHALMKQLFADIERGAFGPLNPRELFAAGISSGGYMTSRMAQAYPERFRALAIASAAWATCAGLLCSVPDRLPTAHPPTLFLHGEQDHVVPIETARAYDAALRKQGLVSILRADPAAGHGWTSTAPTTILQFFSFYRTAPSY